MFDKTLLVQLLATVIAYYVLKFMLFCWTRHQRLQLLRLHGIPGPKPRFLDGSLFDYQKGGKGFEFDGKLQKQYGKVYGIYFGDNPEVDVSDPELLREIFFEKTSSFRERTNVYVDNPITKSILFASFNRWKIMRKIMGPSFSAYSMRGQANMEFIEDTIRQMLKYIDSKLMERPSEGDQPKGVDLDIRDVMKSTALSLISGLAVDLPGVEIRENEPNVRDLDYFLTTITEGADRLAICFPCLRAPLEFMGKYFDYSKLGDIMRRIAGEVDAGLEDLRRAERGEPARQPAVRRPQLIETLIKLHHEGKMTRDEVISNCGAILIAGYDTTSTTLSYIFWVLGKHPEIQERLRSELITHGIESEYLEQVINEVMRLYPTVLNFITRRATETVTIGDVTIPKGCVVGYKTWLMHRDPELWPDPERFDPERFRKGVDFHPCAFAPFGLGDRKCLGYQLAKLELRMVTCDMLMRYKLTTKGPDTLDLVVHSMVMSMPSEKIILNLERL